MRLREILTEGKVGRPFQHLEDLVFVDGTTGAKQALDYLEHMTSTAAGKDYSLKWDGNPTVYWGRESDGTFIFVGKNNWDKASQGGKVSSAKELKQFILSRGKGEVWREAFATNMASMWRVFEKATPAGFRGYLYGDILFSTPPEGDPISFTPNKVTYTVPRDTELGRLLAPATCAVVVHKWLPEFGSNESGKIPGLKKFKTSNGTYWPTADRSLAVLGLYFADTSVKLDTKVLNQLRGYLSQNATALNKFLEGVPGLSNPAGDIYYFVNQQSKAGKLHNLEAAFKAWVPTLGSKKAAAFDEKIRTNPKGLAALFYLVESIMHLKNQVIDQLDQSTPQVIATTGKERGGEGWVYKNVKLVPRDRWQPNL